MADYCLRDDLLGRLHNIYGLTEALKMAANSIDNVTDHVGLWTLAQTIQDQGNAAEALALRLPQEWSNAIAAEAAEKRAALADAG